MGSGRMTILVKSFFFLRGKRVFRWRDLVTGRFVKAPVRMWRLTVAINYVKSGTRVVRGVTEMNAAVCQMWDVDRVRLESLEEHLIAEVKRLVQKDVGYGPVDWWFPVKPSIAYDRVSFEGRLQGKRRCRIEEL